ncbi:sigma-70 family RNA polymerase sigma factor [Streptomyces phaeochromogenes]|uniref:sigma-70 family RNA polymerase sigma factor n=1 Tax=Streptomyces phaeochromogenes TaxID=1923 RepID=UPI0033D33162
MTDLAMPAARRGTPAEQLNERFTTTYARYLPMVRATIAVRLDASDKHLVDDLAQNTFLAFYRYLDRLDGGRDFGGLLRVMARQSISHHFRVMRNTHERPVDVGSWQYADREMGGTGAGYYIPASTGFRTAAITPRPGDSDPDMDEALRRARGGQA